MTLSERLKAETRPAHDAIEAAFDLERWLVSRDSYVRLLRRLHGFHQAMERAAARHLTETGLARHLDRSATLAADLLTLGAYDPDSDLPTLRLPTGRPEAIGAAYVLEGSTLGGLLIAQAVERRLGLGPDTGARFFAGHGRDTMRLWREVQAAIDALSNGAEDECVVAAANRTFGSMQAVLAPNLTAGAMA